MSVQPPDVDTINPTPVAVHEAAITLLAYGAHGNWDSTVTIIQALHDTDGDMLARVLVAYYQMAVNHHHGQGIRDLIGRSLTRMNLNGYSAVGVADAMLDRLAADDMPGYVDTWDGVRFAFGGRNVIPVAATVLLIILGALESEDDSAYMLLDRLTADGAFVKLLRTFGYGDNTVTADCG